MSRIEWVKNVFAITAGAALLGLTYSVFLVSHKITGGGLSGIAAIIYLTTTFPAGVATFLLNIPLFIFAFRTVGKRFLILSAYGLLAFTASIELALLFQTELYGFLGAPDIMVSAVYGGLLGGLGTGFIASAGGSTGGSDLLAGLIHRRRPNLSVGRLILLFDAGVVIANAVVFQDFALALYSIISIFIAMIVIDFVIDGFKECRAYYIISGKYQEIAQEVLQTLGRGATDITVKGMYTNKEKNMLLVLIKKRQQPELRNIIKRLAPDAFIFSVSAKEVLGEGFYPLDPKETSGSKP
jgi:uncharacterized membrane-anchored protein YitT (DUF2179 family)